MFRALLRLYPRWFRDAYGEEMMLLFRSRLDRTKGVGPTTRLWSRASVDALATAIALRRNAWTTPRHEGKGGGVGTLMQDIRYAVRHLLRAPVFAVGAVALLAVGIGANTTVFTVVDALVLRPPPWADPERVVHIYQDSDDGEPNSSSFPAYRDMAASDAFEAVAATTSASAAWEGPDGPTEVAIEYTTSAFLDVLGLSPVRGRWFTSEDDVVGAAPSAVVSAATWRTRLGSDPDVLGSTVQLNGQPVTIIGVGPESLSGTFTPLVTDFWLSIASTVVGGDFRVQNLERRQDHWYDVRGRLAEGVGVERAQASMDALALRLAEEYPDLNEGRDITVYSALDVRMHPSSDAGLYAGSALLGAIVLTVLLLACANLANLLLVRGLGRSGEMAVRRALGAGRGRVARLFLIESAVLAVAGGLAGLLLAGWALSVMPALPLPVPGPAILDLAIDGRVAAFCVLLMAVTGILFGLAPALRSGCADVAQALRDDGRSASPGRGTARLRNTLVAVQVAASLVLVLGTGLLARSLASLQGQDVGVDADRIAWVRTDFTQAGLQGEEAQVVAEEIRARVEALPGVVRAAVTSRLPAERSGSTTTVVEGYTPSTGTDAVELSFGIASPEYFETMGLDLLEGRGFTVDDMPGGETVIVVNETAARRFWGGVDVVGRRMYPQGAPDRPRLVVGVVEDAPVDRLNEATQPMFYFAQTQVGVFSPYVIARVDGDPSSVLSSMRQEVQAVRASLSVPAQGTMNSHFGDGLSSARAAAAGMGAFSLLAVLLAGLGIYSVVSFSVARRSSELGIRIALGAERGRVVRMVVREVVGTVGAGLVVGLVLAGVAASRAGGLLYGVEPLDPLAFAGSVLFLTTVAGTAAYLPARRAAQSDPVDALRAS